MQVESFFYVSVCVGVRCSETIICNTTPGPGGLRNSVVASHMLHMLLPLFQLLLIQLLTKYTRGGDNSVLYIKLVIQFCDKHF